MNLRRAGGVVEEVFDRDGGSDGAARGAHGGLGAALHGRLGAFARPTRAREHAEARHRRDRGQGLAAKAVGRDPNEVFGAADLARGVTHHGELEVIDAHPEAVVGDRHAREAPAVDGDGYGFSLGVKRIFNELLHDRGGAFDDLTRGDLVGHIRGQERNSWHGPRYLPQM